VLLVKLVLVQLFGASKGKGKGKGKGRILI